MKIVNVAILAGLQSKSSSWAGKVLLYGNEYYDICRNKDIALVQYDPKDGRSPLLFDAAKIRNLKGRWRKSTTNKWFMVYDEGSLV